MSEIIEILGSSSEEDEVNKERTDRLRKYHLKQQLFKIKSEAVSSSPTPHEEINQFLLVTDKSEVTKTYTNKSETVSPENETATKRVDLPANDDSSKVERVHRRKSVPQTRSIVSTEMQFQPITVDDDDDDSNDADAANAINVEAAGVDAQKQPVSKGKAANKIEMPKLVPVQKTTPNILAPRLTLEQQVDSACKEFMMQPRNMDLISKIAEERVRINYLLETNTLPEIHFSLNTDPHILNIQLEERLKQRQIFNRSKKRK